MDNPINYQNTDISMEQDLLQKKFKDKQKLSMMRHLVIILDLSEINMQLNDMENYRPCKGIFFIQTLIKFVGSFFDAYPLSQLAILWTSNKRVTLLSNLSGNPSYHINALQQLLKESLSKLEGVENPDSSLTNFKWIFKGEPSLQNSLRLAYKILSPISSLTIRECLIIFGSLTTCDPGDINLTIDQLRKHHIVCSFVQTAAVETFIFKQVANETLGRFIVPSDSGQFEKMLLSNYISLFQNVNNTDTNDSNAPEMIQESQAMLLRVGFPKYISYSNTSNSNVADSVGPFCACHLTNSLDTFINDKNDPNNLEESEDDVQTNKNLLPKGYYSCPICFAQYCHLPIECKVCQLTLVSAPHLARSYSQLFPLPVFRALNSEDLPTPTPLQCFACSCQISNVPTNIMSNLNKDDIIPDLSELSIKCYQCEACNERYCVDCENFIKLSLHACPGCAAKS